MNVEIAFIKTNRRSDVEAQIRSRLQSPPDPPGRQPDWGLPSSYDVLLATLTKRKVAVSPIQGNWIAIVESKEVLDYALLQSLSGSLHTDVVAIVLSEATGCCGYALVSDGKLIEQYFSEEDPDPAKTLKDYLEKKGVSHQLVMFQEAVRSRSLGWTIIENRI